MSHEEFRNRFTIKDGDAIVLWTTSSDSVGFTLTRPYPSECPFIPVKQKDGTDDSVVAIWIGYTPTKIVDHQAKLYIRVSKASRYIFKDHFDFNFDDPESPTKESVEASKHSPQPIDLVELDRFQLNLTNGTFFDNKEARPILPDDIINLIYSVHIETTGSSLRGKFFRTTFYGKEMMANFCGKVIGILEWMNIRLLDKEVKLGERFMSGIDRPHHHTDLRTSTVDTILMPGTDLRLTKKVAIATAMIVFAGFFIDFFYHSIRFVTFLQYNGGNIIFAPVFAISMYVLIDKLVPHLILAITNIFIRLRWYFINMKVHIKL